MSMSIKVKQLIVFLFYNIHKLTFTELSNTIKSILKSVNEETSIQKIKQYLITLIFHTRNSHYGGLEETLVSYDLLFILYDYFPKEIINIIELYIYYGSFKDLNNIIRLSSYDKKYILISQKCYELYVKYLIIDYYKVKYFIEHEGNSVFISDCVKYIPKENKNLDKRTNATHEIVKLLYPKLYYTHKHSALKQFRKLYQPILSLLKHNEQTLEERYDMYKNVSFSFLTSSNIYVRALANNMYSIPDIHRRYYLKDNFLSSYRLYIIDYLYFTHNKQYSHSINIYSMKNKDPDTLRYMLCYYDTYIDYFWNVVDQSFSQDYFKSVVNLIQDV